MRVAKEVPELLNDRVDTLKKVFPEVISEGRVDFEKLSALLSERVDQAGIERFSFSWAGKRNATQILQMPTRATLIPDKKESVSFENTKNLFIEGDNLEVLKLLYQAYFGSVKMIYIDPPYNTGKEFVYSDDYSDPLEAYLALSKQKDDAGNLVTTNVETGGRFHSSWLSMIYPRLFLAKQLLNEDGIIFVSIDDNEMHHLRMVMDEVFGEENFLGCVIWQHSVQPKGYLGKFSVHHNYLLCYQKSDLFSLEALERTEEHNKNYSNPDNDPNGRWRSGDVRNALYRKNLIFDIRTPSNKIIKPPKNGWRWSRETIAKKIKSGEIIFSADQTRIIRKIYLKNVEGRTPETIWFGKDVGTTREAAEEIKKIFDGGAIFDTAKPSRFLKKMLQISTAKGSDDIIMDFFAGSCSTAQAVLEMNKDDGGSRQFIMIQLPEPTSENSEARKAGFLTIADIGKERIRRVISRMVKDEQRKVDNPGGTQDLGFRVFKLAESNYKHWKGVDEKTPEKYVDEMKSYLNPLKEGWGLEGVIHEVMIKEGFPLTSVIKKAMRYKDNNIWSITDNASERMFLICLDEKMKGTTIKNLDISKDDLFVCRDSVLDDTGASNLALNSRLKTI